MWDGKRVIWELCEPHEELRALRVRRLSSWLLIAFLSRRFPALHPQYLMITWLERHTASWHTQFGPIAYDTEQNSILIFQSLICRSLLRKSNNNRKSNGDRKFLLATGICTTTRKSPTKGKLTVKGNRMTTRIKTATGIANTIDVLCNSYYQH